MTKAILLSRQRISEGLQKFEFVTGTSINSSTCKLIRRHVMKSSIHQKRTRGILALRTTAIRPPTHRAAVSDAAVDAHDEEDDDDQFHNSTRKYPE